MITIWQKLRHRILYWNVFYTLLKIKCKTTFFLQIINLILKGVLEGLYYGGIESSYYNASLSIGGWNMVNFIHGQFFIFLVWSHFMHVNLLIIYEITFNFPCMKCSIYEKTFHRHDQYSIAQKSDHRLTIAWSLTILWSIYGHFSKHGMFCIVSTYMQWRAKEVHNNNKTHIFYHYPAGLAITHIWVTSLKS